MRGDALSLLREQKPCGRVYHSKRRWAYVHRNLAASQSLQSPSGRNHRRRRQGPRWPWLQPRQVPLPKLTYLELVCCAAYCNERFHDAHQRCIANTWRIICKAVSQHDVKGLKGQSENRVLPDSLAGYAWSSRAVIKRRSAELR